MRKMNPLKEHQDINTQRAFWAAIVYTIVAAASVGLAVFLITQYPIWQVFLMAAIAVVSFGLDLAAVICIKRDRPELALQILYWSGLFTVPFNTLLFVGVTYFLTAIVLVVGFVNVFYLFPPEWRGRYQFGPIIAAVVMLILDYISPSFRINLGGSSRIFGSIVLGFIIISTVVIVLRQAWARTIRTRLLAFSLGLTLLSIAVVAFLAVNSLLSTGQQAQETGSAALIEQAEAYLLQQTIDSAQQNDLILQKTSQDASNVAHQTAYIFENPDAFNSQHYWAADDKMFLGPEGQYVNSVEDVSTVFVPNTITVDDDLKKTIELSAYLDMTFIPVFENDPNSVAIYYIGKQGISRLYPNINLGEILPADFSATDDIFFTIGNPENNPQREVVWTPVYDDPAGQGLLVSAIAPIYNSLGDFLGVIGIDISLSELTESIEKAELVVGGYSFLIDTYGRALALPDQGYQDILGRDRDAGEFGPDLATSRSEFSQIIANMIDGNTGFESTTVEGKELFIAYTPLKSTGWRIASVIEADQILEPATNLQTELEALSQTLIIQRIIPAGAVLVVIVLVVGIFITNRLVDPIEQLTESAAQIGAGELDTPLPESELYEIDTLSNAIRNMVNQLKSALGTLEERIAARTRDLRMAAEVGQSLSLVRQTGIMLTEAVEIIRERFDLYYTQVYLTDSTGRTLVLRAGTGEVGQTLLNRGHRLPIDMGSLNGIAATERRAVIVEDTKTNPLHRANPLLPDTRSEMVVPLQVRERVIGVLDMQSNVPGALSDENLVAFEALAGQLAIAITNASLFDEAERTRATVEEQTRRSTREGWQDFLDAIHRGERLAYTYDRETITAFDEPLLEAEDETTLVTPIRVSGASVGKLQFMRETPWTEDDYAISNAVANQVAQQIENLRLLAQSEQYQTEAQEALRRLTREGWEGYQEQFEIGRGFIYQDHQVKPLEESSDGFEEMLTYEINVRDEPIGELAIAGPEALSEDDAELVVSVNERLSAHLENLRLSNQTERALIETEQQAKVLAKSATERAALNEISNRILAEKDATAIYQYVTQSLVDNFGMSFARVWIYEAATNELVLQVSSGEYTHTDGPHGRVSMASDRKLAWIGKGVEPHVTNDLYNDSRVDNKEWVREKNLKAFAGYPLFAGGELLGVMGMFSYDQIQESTQAVLASLAVQVGTIINTQRLSTQAQQRAQREQALRQITAAVRSSTDPATIMRTAVRELGIALGRRTQIRFVGSTQAAKELEIGEDSE